jgi:hypothetical protein
VLPAMSCACNGAIDAFVSRHERLRQSSASTYSGRASTACHNTVASHSPVRRSVASRGCWHCHAVPLLSLAVDCYAAVPPTLACRTPCHAALRIARRTPSLAALAAAPQDQKLTLLMARKLMLDDLLKLSAERGTLGALGSELVPSSSFAFLTAQTRMESVELPLAEQLHRNMMRQKHVHVLMFMFLFEHVLDDVQYAKLWVHCFPRVPFALNIMNVIAAEHDADQLCL